MRTPIRPVPGDDDRLGLLRPFPRLRSRLGNSEVGPGHERAETWSEANPEGRWRYFGYEDLLKRDKLSLDLFWIKDKTLTDTDSLPLPDIITTEIADDLEAALEQFTKIAAPLGKTATAR